MLKDYDGIYNKYIKPNAVAFVVGAAASYFLTGYVVQALDALPVVSGLSGTSKVVIANGLFAATAAPVAKWSSSYY